PHPGQAGRSTAGVRAHRHRHRGPLLLLLSGRAAGLHLRRARAAPQPHGPGAGRSAGERPGRAGLRRQRGAGQAHRLRHLRLPGRGGRCAPGPPPARPVPGRHQPRLQPVGLRDGGDRRARLHHRGVLGRHLPQRAELGEELGPPLHPAPAPADGKRSGPGDHPHAPARRRGLGPVPGPRLPAAAGGRAQGHRRAQPGGRQAGHGRRRRAHGLRPGRGGDDDRGSHVPGPGGRRAGRAGVGGSQARRRPRPQRRDGPVSAPTGTQDHERVPRSPGAYLRWLSGQVGPSGLKPVLVLLTLSAVERFGITIIAVLGPNIRDTFHVSNQTLIGTVALTSILPAAASPWVGYLSDRVDRVRLGQISAVIVGVGAIGLALAPNFPVFAIVAVTAGAGLLVNTPTHSSLSTEREERSNFWEGFRRVSAVRSLKRTWTAAFFFGGGVVAFLSLLNVFFKDVYHYNTAERGLITVVFGVGGLVGTVIGGGMVQKVMRGRGPQMLPVITGIMVVEFGIGIVVRG